MALSKLPNGSRPSGIADAEEPISSFFRMPRELRDMIYDNLLTEAFPLSRRSGFRLWLRHVPRLNSLLVSRQFRHELLERKTKGPHLVAEDQQQNIGLGEALGLKPSRVNLTSIELHLAFSCSSRCQEESKCSILSALSMHGSGISVIMSRSAFSTVRKLSLDLYLRPHEFVTICEQRVIDCFNNAAELAKRLRDAVSTLDQRNQLARFDVYRCDFGDHDLSFSGAQNWSFSGEKTRIMEYSRETQTLKRIKAHGDGPL